MATSAFLAATKASIENLVSVATLIDLTNQRRNETGTAGGPPPVLAVVDAVLEEAIEMAALEIEAYLGVDLASTDVLAIKLAVELTLSDLAVKFAVNASDLGLSNRADIFRRAERIAASRRGRADRIKSDDKTTNYDLPPSGHDPFDGI